MQASYSLSQKVVGIMEEFLGPAAERFIARLIDSHLHKSAEELKLRDIPKLAEWVKVSLGLLTSDREVVDDCHSRILSLAKK